VRDDDDWLAWWRGDALQQPQEPPDLPEIYEWGMALDHTFSDYSNETPESVRAKLIEMFRQGTHGNDLLALLADMLDPDGDSLWRLELSRRRRGRRGRFSELDLMALVWQYEMRVQELKDERRAAPVKTALGEFADAYKMTDEEMRALIGRASGKRKRAPKKGAAVRK
jgi:hypothetical protein